MEEPRRTSEQSEAAPRSKPRRRVSKLGVATAVSGLVFSGVSLNAVNELFFGPERVAEEALFLVTRGQLSQLDSVITDEYAETLGDKSDWLDTPLAYSGEWDIVAVASESPSRELHTLDYEIGQPGRESETVRLTVTSEGLNPILGPSWKVAAGLPLYRIGLESSSDAGSASPPELDIIGISEPVAFPAGGFLVGPHSFSITVRPAGDVNISSYSTEVNPFEEGNTPLSRSDIVWKPEYDGSSTPRVVSLVAEVMRICAESPRLIIDDTGLCAGIRVDDVPRDLGDYGEWEDFTCSVSLMPELTASASGQVESLESGLLRCAGESGAGFVLPTTVALELYVSGKSLEVRMPAE